MTPLGRAATQHERELLVMSTLDLTAGDYHDVIRVAAQDPCACPTPAPPLVEGERVPHCIRCGRVLLLGDLEQPLVDLYVHLQAGAVAEDPADADAAGRLYIQAIATCADSTLYGILQLVTGSAPFAA